MIDEIAVGKELVKSYIKIAREDINECNSLLPEIAQREMVYRLSYRGGYSLAVLSSSAFSNVMFNTWRTIANLEQLVRSATIPN